MRRVLVLLAVAGLLAGCASSLSKTPADQHGGSQGPSIAELRAQAAVAACPAVPAASVSPVAQAAGGLPDATLPCLAGGPDVPLRRLTGTATVMNLWASWCGPCREELPGFQKAFERADPTRLRVMGVVTEDPGLSRQLSFAVDTGLRMPSLVDDKGVVSRALGIRGLPATLFVAPDGSVARVHNGPLTYDELRTLTERYLHVQINA